VPGECATPNFSTTERAIQVVPKVHAVPRKSHPAIFCPVSAGRKESSHEAGQGSHAWNAQIRRRSLRELDSPQAQVTCRQKRAPRFARKVHAVRLRVLALSRGHFCGSLLKDFDPCACLV
jgi:hypothetical protein